MAATALHSVIIIITNIIITINCTVSVFVYAKAFLLLSDI